MSDDGWDDFDQQQLGDAYDSFDSFDDSFDAAGIDAAKVGSGNLIVDKPGWYHFIIEATAKPSPYATGKDGKTDMAKSRKPSILLACKVLAASEGGSPIGSIYYHDLIVGGKGPGVQVDAGDKERTLNFLVGVGICFKRGDAVIDPETGTTMLKVSTLTARLNGRQFVGHIKFSRGGEMKDGNGHPIMDASGNPRMWEDKYQLPFGRGAYQVDDEIVADAPKSLEHLKLIGKEDCMPRAKASAAKSSTATAATKPAEKPAAKSLADLPD